MSTNNPILEILKEEKPYLQKNFGVLSLGLFGSYAQNKETTDSDVDLLVELKEPRYEFLVGVQMHLEAKLGKHVDVIRKRQGMSERFLRRIEKDICYV